ncbi:MAG: hypothetical protein JWQ17_6982 [Tardiphaga sp.]|nr:hypothetical protein [Tardiphaga sp.]
MKSAILAAAVLLSATTAFGQTDQPQPIKPQPIKPHPKPAAVHAAKSQEILDITQIVGVRQVDAATYEIDAKLQDGSPIDLRMNAFVMQDLGRQLGTYGRH